MRKLAAHDEWVCLRCRWTAKLPLVDVRSPELAGHRCPGCGRRMLWTGTAFRPPRQDDDEGWEVVRSLLEAGFRYHGTRSRRRVPRTRKELEAWLAAQAAPEGWLAEKVVRVRRGASGPAVRWGPRELADRERVVVWHDGAWREGELLLTGDGGRPLAAPVVKLARRGSVALATGSRVRVRR